MSYQSRRMNSILTLNVIIVLVNSQPTLARMCYVCGAGSEEPFTQNSKSHLEYPNIDDIPLSCDEFESTNNLDKFIFTCPLDYVGCITQSDGTDVTRTCDMLPINDCQTANGVEYCYCTTDLCNNKKLIPSKKKPDTLYDDDDTSDMDEFEASGYSSIDTIISDDTMETTSLTTTHPPVVRNIESPSTTATIATKITTVATTTTSTTTTEATIILTEANKVVTTSYNRSHILPPTTTTAAEATYNNNATNLMVKCSMVTFIVQLLMLKLFV